ncbi:MAG: DUF4922 domain-containing protein [Rhodothermaceae bacterium]|nr:DUF4922 domain-containing protein [Rhodothermaceae bacterium]
MRDIDQIHIQNSELEPFGPVTDPGSAASALLLQQGKTWPLLSGNYDGLNSVRVKRFSFDGFSVKVQFNPGRIVSSSAKVDAKSISERKCFLCRENLPAEQRGILLDLNYLVLANPFPIFPEHLTIPHLEHIPQAITGAFGDMMEITRSLGSRFSLFYNGPKCGASAPDHLHFQAGNRGFLPIESELSHLVTTYGEPVPCDEALSVHAVDDTLRRYFVARSGSKDQLQLFFEAYYQAFDEISSTGEEPMMNILAWYDEPVWTVLFFLREKHRPSHYFREDEGNILLSPASVDFGGVCITPREKDYEKMSTESLREIFSEVSLNREAFSEVVKRTSIPLHL